MSRPPQLWLIAGPNGAGKSTLVARFHLGARMEIINPDEIAAQLQRADHARRDIAMAAGRIALARRQTLLAAGESFGIETTLTGHGEQHLIGAARARGYKVTIVFLGLDGAMIALARVRERIARGGHAIPADIIERRFEKGLAALPAVIAGADRAFVLDNSGSRHRLLAVIEAGRPRYVSDQPPAWVVPLLAALGGRVVPE